MVLVPCCLLRPGMDWFGSFFLSFFLFCLEDRDSVLECLGGEFLFLVLRDLEADLDLPLLFLGLGGGVILLAEGPGDGVLGGDLVPWISSCWMLLLVVPQCSPQTRCSRQCRQRRTCPSSWPSSQGCGRPRPSWRLWRRLACQKFLLAALAAQGCNQGDGEQECSLTWLHSAYS